MRARDVTERFLRSLLTVVVRYCLRSGLRIREVEETLKELFLTEAIAELETSGQKVSVSRLHVTTGIHRKDISNRLLEPSAAAEQKDLGLIAKVLGAWQTDRRFTTSRGAPRVLSYRTADCSFRDLVTSVSKELNPTSVLYELQRVRAVEVQGSSVRLLRDTYTPTKDLDSGLSLLSDDIQLLLHAVEENLLDAPDVPNLHARTEFDNIRPDAVETVRAWLVREGHRFHRKVRDYLSEHDQDISPIPGAQAKGIRVSLGTFSSIDEGETEK